MTTSQPFELRFDELDPSRRHDVLRTKSAALRLVYPFDQLQIGHWFRIPCNDRYSENRVHAAASKASKRTGFGFRIHKSQSEDRIYVVRTS